MKFRGQIKTKYRLYKKGGNKKTIAFLTVICFLTVSISQCIADPEPLEDPTPLCYGFIVPLARCDNWTIEDQINCKTRNMINDLLREQIPVYWTATNATLSIRKIDDETEHGMFFERGAFIIPFTEIDVQDIKIIAIVCDYNYSSEIEESNTVKIQIYLLTEPLKNIQVYPLSEVKIAQYKSYMGDDTDCESYFVEVASKCGFLNFEFLERKQLAKKLNNTAFNIIIFPGNEYHPRILPLYNTLRLSILGECFEDLLYKVPTKTREFISNGGGYIGSCAGASKASCASSSDSRLLSYFYLKRAYNPKLHSIYFLAVSDVTCVAPPANVSISRDVQANIVNDSHPVTYGLDRIVPDDYGGGPLFDYIGKNSQVIARLHNTSNSEFEETPSWISSQFGKGRVIIFSTHPMIVADDNGYRGNIGKTIMSNTFYYTTFKEITKLDLSQSKNLSFIWEVWEKTADLSNGTDETKGIFDEFKGSINENIGELTNLTNKIYMMLDVIREIAAEKHIDLNESWQFLYYGPAFYVAENFLGKLIGYFKNILETLNTIEKIYPLLKNDASFIQQIETLKNDLSKKFKEIKSEISKCWYAYQYYEDALSKCQQSQKISKIQEQITSVKGYKLEKQVVRGFLYIPQIYFNSLKLLRTSWYNYEASIAL